MRQQRSSSGSTGSTRSGSSASSSGGRRAIRATGTLAIATCLAIAACICGAGVGVAGGAAGGSSEEYTYSIRLGTSDPAVPYGNGAGWTRSSVNDVDDAPFDGVNLPFTFRYFGTNYNRVYISPNGCLHFRSRPPCCDVYYPNGQALEICSIQTQDCNVNNYDLVIAAVLTDLFPGSVLQPTTQFVRYKSTTVPVSRSTLDPSRSPADVTSPADLVNSTATVMESVFVVRFQNIPLFYDTNNPVSPGGTFTFNIIIWASGRITFEYEKVYDPRTIGGWGGSTRPFLIGLRPDKLTPSSGVANAGDYGPQTPTGIYPPASALVSGFTIHFWPIRPRSDCTTPAASIQLVRATPTAYITSSIDITAGAPPPLATPPVIPLTPAQQAAADAAARANALAAGAAFSFGCQFNSSYSIPIFSTAEHSIFNSTDNTTFAYNTTSLIGYTPPIAYSDRTIAWYDSATGLIRCFLPATIAGFASVADAAAASINTTVTVTLLERGVPLGRMNGRTIALVNATDNADPTIYGNSTLPEYCEWCNAYRSDSLCFADCTGAWLGTAAPDDCGVCSGGAGDHLPNEEKDCADICFGPFNAAAVFPESTAHWHVNTTTGNVNTTQCLCVAGDASSQCFNSSLIDAVSTRAAATYLSQLQIVHRTDSGAAIAAAVAARENAIINQLIPAPFPFAEQHAFIAALNNALSAPGVWSLSTATGVNDWPLQFVALPFAFPFFGSAYNGVYISPDGAIFFRPFATAACATNGARQLFVQASNGVATLSGLACEYVGIAASLTDYAPSPLTTPAVAVASAGTSIRYTVSDSAFSVRYTNLTLAIDLASGQSGSAASRDAMAVRHSFQISLFANGRVIVSYDSISDPTAVPSFSPNATREWAVGALLHAAPATSDLGYTTPAGYILSPFGGSTEAEYGVSNRTLPFSSVAAPNFPRNADVLSRGVYPPRATVAPDRTIQYCMFGRGSCNTPKFGAAEGGTSIRISVTAIEECAAFDLDLMCRFWFGGGNDYLIPPVPQYVDTPARYNATLHALVCVSPPGRADFQTVPLELVDAHSGIVYSVFNNLFFSYLPATDPRVNQPDTTARLCDDCAAFNPGLCVADCAGVWGGTAYLDDCLVCSSGITNHTANAEMDCAGVCFGPFLQLNTSLSTVANPQVMCACSFARNPVACAQFGNYSTYVLPGGANFNSAYQPVDSVALGLSRTVLLQNVTRAAASAASTGSQWIDANVTFTANAPLQPINLKFTFHFFGLAVRRVWVSDDGALYVRSVASNCTIRGARHLFLLPNSTVCTYAIIAPSLTDYDATLRPDDATVRYQSTADELIVQWTNMPLALSTQYTRSLSAAALTATATQLSHSFGVRISSANSSIEFSYDRVFDPRSVLHWTANDTESRNWAVGLIFSGDASFVNPFVPPPHIAEYISFRNSPLAPALTRAFPPPGTSDAAARSPVTYARFGTRNVAFGAVLAPAAVVLSASSPVPTGSPSRVLRLCRSGLHACITPSFGVMGGGTTVHIAIADTSCIALAAVVWCRFGSVEVVATYNAVSHFVECITPAGVPSAAVPVVLVVSSIPGTASSYSPDAVLLPIQPLRFVYLSPNDYSAAYTRGMALTVGNSTAVVAAQQSNKERCIACARLNPKYCVKDCSDTYRGFASYDDCGRCTNGNTGLLPNYAKDCAGICFGPYDIRAAGGYSTQCLCNSGTECDPYSALDGPVPTTLTVDPLTDFLSTSLVFVCVAGAFIVFVFVYGCVLACRRAVASSNVMRTGSAPPDASRPVPQSRRAVWWQPPNPTPLWNGDSDPTDPTAGLNLRGRRAAGGGAAAAAAALAMENAAARGAAGGAAGSAPIPPRAVATVSVAAELAALGDDPDRMIDGVRLRDIQ